ncbi:MAG: hypothetical protein K9L56_14710 [Clostridiales bacterium]|nr:hypothetical protein [Clostridiales bacterium]
MKNEKGNKMNKYSGRVIKSDALFIGDSIYKRKDGSIWLTRKDLVWGDWIEIHPKSLAMGTILKDKNDEQIFGSIPVNGEMSRGGNIIEWEGRGNMFDNDLKRCTSYIIFKYAQWYPKPIDVHGLRSIELSPFNSKNYKIIGNAFDNPELLENNN